MGQAAGINIDGGLISGQVRLAELRLLRNKDKAKNNIGGQNMEYKFTAANFESEVLNSEIPVFVDFYADWCGPCKMMAPIVEELAVKYDGRVKVGKCNIDEEDGLARLYRVMSIPTMKIFVGGKEAGTIVGAVPQEELEAQIAKVL